MSAHTPGPWKASKEPDGFEHYKVSAGGVEFISVARLETPETEGTDPDFPETSKLENGIAKANSRLIAAAPDMLESLRECHDLLVAAHMGTRIVARARKAIAKAEGRG